MFGPISDFHQRAEAFLVFLRESLCDLRGLTLTETQNFVKFVGRKGPPPIVESPYLVGSDQNLNWMSFVYDRS